jgi:CheY-like chemotaxis protein
MSDTILVIDDNAAYRRILCKMLESAGYKAVAAEDGEKGLALYDQTNPSLVITDLVMPNTEGIETIRELRRHNPSIPIIAISGDVSASPLYLKAAGSLGATASLAKPFGMEQLLSIVRQLLAADQSCDYDATA